MLDRYTIMFAAGIGGIAPSLIHLAQGFIKPTPDVPGVFYYAGVAIFFGMGALVAHFFSETSAKKAFFLGIGLPALVATAQTQGPKLAMLNVLSSAYAQQKEVTPESVVGAKIKFLPSNECQDCELWFSDSAGTVISKQVWSGGKDASVLFVPKSATSIGIADPKANFKLVPLPPGAAAGSIPLTIEYSRKYSPWSDLRRGLGNYDLKSYDPNVELVK